MSRTETTLQVLYRGTTSGVSGLRGRVSPNLLVSVPSLTGKLPVLSVVGVPSGHRREPKCTTEERFRHCWVRVSPREWRLEEGPTSTLSCRRSRFLKVPLQLYSLSEEGPRRVVQVSIGDLVLCKDPFYTTDFGLVVKPEEKEDEEEKEEGTGDK